MGMFAGVSGEAGLWANRGGRVKPIASSSEGFVVDDHGPHSPLLNAISVGVMQFATVTRFRWRGTNSSHGHSARLADAEPTSLLIGLLVLAQQPASISQCLAAQLVHCILLK